MATGRINMLLMSHHACRRTLPAALLLACLPYGAAADGDAPPAEEAIDEVTVFGERLPEKSPFGFTLEAEELTNMPGTQNDPIKAVVALPGVLTNDDFDTGVALRGTRPNENRYYMDFLPTGYLFHLTGLSVVDGDMVAQLRLLSAGFGVTYQGVVGGIISANTRDPQADEWGGLADISLLDAGLMVEGPVSQRQRVAVSARVSYYDLVIGNLVEDRQEEEEAGLDIVQLPRYTDYRARYQLDIGGDGKLDFLVDGATDDVRFNLDETSDEATLDPARAGRYLFDIAYSRQGIVYSQPWRAGMLRVGLGHIRSDLTGEFGDTGHMQQTNSETVFRLVNRTNIARHSLKLGMSLSAIDLEQDLVVRDNGCTEFDVECLYTDKDFETSRIGLNYAGGNLFVEDEIALAESWDLTFGLGYTADDYLNGSEVEPRLRLDWRAAPFLTLSAGAGRYSQMPDFEYTDPNLGNPELSYVHADHYVLGADGALGRGYLASVNVFYKNLGDIVTSDPLTRYDSRGAGRAWGAEFLLRKGLGKLTGWTSLTWSRSFRTDTKTGRTSRFEYDQPLSASLVARYEISEKLSLGGRIAYHSGPPVTPIFGGRPDPNREGGYLPNYGELNSDRLPAYFRTDLRLDWNTGWRNISVYFEIINVTNHENVAGYDYSRDYSARSNVEQLPRFASFGVKKRW
ncbi:MAG: TonB-dependent receptor [Woeseia sp.]